MGKRTVLSLATIAILGASATASAQVYSNVCWTVNGFPVRTSLTAAGSASGNAIYDVDGFGTASNVGIKGTLVIPPTGSVRFSFLIQAASPGQNAVVHQLALSRTTLNGTGNFRWFDGTEEGETTATLVACGAAAASGPEDRAAQGLK